MPYLSFFENIHQVKNFDGDECSFETLVETFKEDEREEKEKKGGFVFNGSVYPVGASRVLKNIKEVRLIILDYDNLGPDDPETLWRQLKSYQSVLYTTHRHTIEKPKLRAIVVPSKPIPPSEYKTAVTRLGQHIGLEYDPVSKNPNQVYYFPTCPPGTKEMHFTRINADGSELDLESLPPVTMTKATTKGKRVVSSEEDEKNLYTLATQVVETEFPDGLVFVRDVFYEYRDGYWQEVDNWSLKQKLTNDDSPYAALLPNPGAVNSLIDALKARTSLVKFPDPKPLTLCLQNAVLDIATGSQMPHAPDYWHRNLLDIQYHEDDVCPLWQRFLDETFAGDADGSEKKLFLQEFMGYLLVPSTEAQMMLWMIGSGANGKSVVIEVMQSLLGADNHSSVPLDSLGQDFKKAVLQGKLANFCPEISGSRRIDEATIKSIVGGDEIYAEKKGKDGFSFRAYARIVAAGNALPDVGDTSHGFFRRLTILRFNRQLSVEEMDRELPEKLKNELSGILAWALAGLKRFREQKRFTDVPSSRAFVSSYKLQSNPVEVFLTECTKVVAGKKTLKSDVYASYKAFCQEGGHQPLANNKFGAALSELGYAAKASNGKGYYPLVLAGGNATAYSRKLDVVEVLEDDE
ncbi:DNA primase family protein [Cupriavidus metallidurans]|uniref:DNA primase activity n=1 Tax=Cupriavidus metallidurans (strain ATCC 43123 / DSM 2839 / NBRC 102507 / CH34) TaxID=266264 RepID=Q1LJZ1_CUPMC|nr:DNA primase family protein [Cupriavidus metallidurans]ABF09535.1 DNA primase activity [Cupriavidus metallidurans CH34]QGS29607.1 hypothetical protein FOB83_12335 [Cupriavidus metallidurans]